MIMLSTIYFLIINTLFFLKTKHPLTMGLTLLVQTLLICLLTGMTNKTFWFSYILFLIFLGSMLILFIYMTAIASNEMFFFSIKSMTMNIILISICYVIFMFLFDLFYLQKNNIEMTQFSMILNLMNENCTYLNKIYNFPSNIMTIILMNYLLLTLIAVVKITNIFYGPLRTLK